MELLDGTSASLADTGYTEAANKASGEAAIRLQADTHGVRAACRACCWAPVLGLAMGSLVATSITQ